MSVNPEIQTLVDAFEKAIDPLKAEILEKTPSLEALAVAHAPKTPKQDRWQTDEGKVLHAVGHVFNVLIHCSMGNFKGVPQEIDGVLFRIEESKIREDLRVLPLLEKIQQEVVKTSEAISKISAP